MPGSRPTGERLRAVIPAVPGHHLVYGTLRDFLTGAELPDTDDERFRQSLARLLVEERGFDPAELEARRTIETLFNNQFVRTTIDLTVRVDGCCLMIVRYGPGSLVTRERPALAAARVLETAGQIPLAVVTNGRDAELLNVLNGEVLAEGMASIPDRARTLTLAGEFGSPPLLDPRRREKELRILNAYDLEVCCRGDRCQVPGAR